VVSTDLAEVHSFGSVCKIAHTGEEFLQYTETFINETASTDRQRTLAEHCRAQVRDHDWQQRVREISNLLELRLPRKL
jgi:hypothetical protein